MENEKSEYVELPLKEGTYKTTLNGMFLRRKPWVPANPKHLLSFIPGVVVQINVAEGQFVKEGEELMMYKAMKMDNRILSPMDGKIKAICVQVGENLPKGALMIEFE